MLMTEWNWDDAKEVWQREAHEKGKEEGIEKGRELGREEIFKLFDQGLSMEEIKQRTRSKMC